MGQPYSQDLRERVVEGAAATSRSLAAARLWVGISTSIRWMAALTATGTVAARLTGSSAFGTNLKPSAPEACSHTGR